MEREANMLPNRGNKQGIIKMCRYEKGVYGVTSGQEVVVGDQFVIGESNGGPVVGVVDIVIESRRDKGTYQDEVMRRWWSKVKIK